MNTHRAQKKECAYEHSQNIYCLTKETVENWVTLFTKALRHLDTSSYWHKENKHNFGDILFMI